jgi:hypothetical protein
VDAKSCHPFAIADERRADERGNAAGEELLALRGCQSRVETYVIDDNRLTATVCVDESASEEGKGTAAGQRRHSTAVGPADDELVAVDVRVVDPAGVEMLTEQPKGDFLDRQRVAQLSKILVEPDQELPLVGHTF